MLTRHPRRRAITTNLYGIIGTGQSLSVGARAGGVPYDPIVTTTTNALVLRGMSDGAGGYLPPNTWSVVPLTEPLRGDGLTSTTIWPTNVAAQSPHAAMSNEIAIAHPAAILFHHVVGQDGQGMDGIKKGGSVPSYAGSILEVTRANAHVTAAGFRYIVVAVALTHGETDYGSATYEADMLQLLADYNADVKAITGQTRDIRMIFTQPSAGWPRPAGEASNIPDTMLTAWLNHPDKFLLVGPKTGYSYAPSVPTPPNDFHLDAAGTCAMGTEYGKAISRMMSGLPDIAPLYPLSATVNPPGTVVTVTLNRAVQIDNSLYGDTHLTQHASWRDGAGFEIRNSGGTALGISSISVSGAVVTINVASGTPATVSYTLFGDGPGTIRRGKIRDADGRWLVQFSRSL